MGNLNLGRFNSLGESKFLEKQFDKEVSEDDLQLSLNNLASIEDLIGENDVCYVFGMGGHPKSTYTQLPKSPNYELIWYGSILPFLLKPLSILIATYAGLVKINKPNDIDLLLKTLSESSMVGLFIFDKENEKAFIDAVKSGNQNNEADVIAKKSSNFLCYYIDADSHESKTGIYEIVSYGKDCKEIIKNVWI